MAKYKYLVQTYGRGDFEHLLKSLDDLISKGHGDHEAIFIHYHKDTIATDPITNKKFYKPFFCTIQQLKDRINELVRSGN